MRNLKIIIVNYLATPLLSIVASLIYDRANGHLKSYDSLQLQRRSTFLTDHCDALYDLAYQIVDDDTGAGIIYGQQCLEIALKLGDTTRMLKAARITSYAYRQMGLIDSSYGMLIKYVPIARRHHDYEQLKHMLNGLGITYLNKSIYDQALAFSFEALEIRQKYGSQKEVGIAFNNLGLVYFKLEDYDMAIRYFSKSMSIGIKLNDKYIKSLAASNLSLCFAYKKQYGRALFYLRIISADCGSDCPKRTLIYYRFIEGLISFGQNKFQNAEHHFLESYKISKELNNVRMQLDNLCYLSRTYVSSGQVNKLRGLVIVSEDLIQTRLYYSDGVTELCFGLIKLYEREGNLLKANEYKTKYITLKDSLFNHELTKNLMRVEARYNEQKHLAEIDSQNEILALNEELIDRQYYLNIALSVVVILCAIMLIVLMRNNQLKKFTNSLLEHGVKERTLELEKKQALHQQIFDERNIQLQRISDDVRRALVTIKGLCILGARDKETQMADEYLNRIDQTSDQLLSIINRFSGG